MAPTAGSDIESICSKCGDVWHVIIAMVGDKIAKVECKECHGTHRYKAPSGAKKTATTAKAAKTAKKKTTRKTSRKTAAGKSPSDLPETGPAVEADISKPTRPYKATETFEVAERVDHPKFGIGVVELSVPGRVTAWFPVGRKVIAQAKEGLKLERPARFVHHDSPGGAKQQ